MTPRLGPMVLRPGKLMDLPLGQLNMDPSYQRKLNRSWSKHIAASLDPDKFGTLLIGQRKGGKYWVVDGQHRVIALQILGWDEKQKVPCNVHESSGPEEEAKWFVAANSEIKTVRTIDSFFARVTAGDKIATAVQAIVREVGLEVSRTAANGCVAATSACEAVYTGKSMRRARAVSAPALRDTLRILISAWGQTREAVCGLMVFAIGAILRSYPGIDQERLIKVLSAYPGGPVKLVADARHFAKYQSVKGGPKHAIADAVIGHYNKGLRTNQLPRWRDVR